MQSKEIDNWRCKNLEYLRIPWTLRKVFIHFQYINMLFFISCAKFFFSFHKILHHPVLSDSCCSDLALCNFCFSEAKITIRKEDISQTMDKIKENKIRELIVITIANVDSLKNWRNAEGREVHEVTKRVLWKD